METLHVETLSPSRVPPQLQAYMSPGEWTTFCTDVKAARKDICQKAVCVELGLCCGFGLFCSFCFHPCIEDIMDSGKLEGACNTANGRCFRKEQILTIHAKDLMINVSLLATMPRISQQVEVGTHSPMQHPQAQGQGHPQFVQPGQQLQYVQGQPGQPQYMQGQPQYMQGQPQHMQGQPQYIQGQPQYIQGQPQYIQGQPQYIQGQPQYIQGQPQYVHQGQPPPPQYAQHVPPPQYIPQGQHSVPSVVTAVPVQVSVTPTPPPPGQD